MADQNETTAAKVLAASKSNSVRTRELRHLDRARQGSQSGTYRRNVGTPTGLASARHRNRGRPYGLCSRTSCSSVVATDVTPEMLEVAEAMAAERDINNVTFAEADAHSLGF